MSNEQACRLVVYNPSYRRTAEKVAELLGAIPINYTALSGTEVSPQFLRRAIHFAYPDYTNMPRHLATSRQLFTMSKLQQRRVLQRFFNVPILTKDWEGKVVVRERRHSRGSGFIVKEDITQVPIGEEYVAPLIERDWEARLIIALGRLVYAYKRVGDNQDEPWNANFGSRITVVKNLASLVGTLGTLPQDLSRFFSVFTPNVIGIDIAKVKGKNDYVVFEVNFAPGMPTVRGKRLAGIARAIANRARRVLR